MTTETKRHQDENCARATATADNDDHADDDSDDENDDVFCRRLCRRRRRVVDTVDVIVIFCVAANSNTSFTSNFGLG